MSFLKNMFNAATDGFSGFTRGLGRGIEDLAKFDLSSAGNEFENSYKSLSSVPGFGLLRGIYLGANGDLSWNPYDSDEASVFDYAMGGSASEDPNNRRIGRMIGTAAATWGLGSGLSAAGMSTTGASATAGATMSAAQTAGAGGDRGDIFKSAMAGGGSAALGSYASGLDAAGTAGVTNPTFKAAINSGIGGGVSAAANGGSSSDIARGAAIGAVQGAASTGGKVSNYEEGGYSRAPWANQSQVDSILGVERSAPYNPAAGYGAVSTVVPEERSPWQDYTDRLLGSFKTADGSWDGAKIRGTADTLMGLYGGYKQRRMAREYMRGLNTRRDAYSQQLQRGLLRKDAAAGRRSDYSGREVELQAKLAALDAQQAPAIMKAQEAELGGLFNMINSANQGARTFGLYNMGTAPAARPAPTTTYQAPYLSNTIGRIPPADYSLDLNSLFNERNKFKFGGS